MSEFMLQLDYNLFYFINHTLKTGVGDFLMPLFREKLFWYPLYIVFIVMIIQMFSTRSYIIILSLCVVVLFADQISSHVIKPMVKRTRPCNLETLESNIHVLETCRNSYSFTSSHATNHFAVAAFLFYLFAGIAYWKRLLLFAWAGLISIAQVYVGLHFPLDIAGGCLVGLVVGILSFRVLNYLYLKPINKTEVA